MENEDQKPEEPTPETAQPEPPKWEYRNEFKITGRMRDVVGLTIKATEAELAVLRRKLNKLTYGS